MRFPLDTMNAAKDQSIAANSLTEGAPGKAADRKRRGVITLLKCCAALTVPAIAGCDTRGFFDPTEMVRGGHPNEPLMIPILNHVDPTIEENNNEFVTATDPTPEDLVSSTNDYRIGRNDLLSISISDLVGPGQETVKTARVTESGNISLPYLGPVRAEGLTEIELEQAIVQAYRDANLIQNATVTVTVVEARGRTVEILGAVNQPGQYAILDPDFRLLDALVLARDTTSPLVEYAYVIRKSEAPRQTGGQAHPKPLPGGHAPASAPAPDDLAPKSDAGQPGPAFAVANHPLTLLAAAPGDDLAPGAPSAAVPATQPSTEPATLPAPPVPDPSAVIPPPPEVMPGAPGGPASKPFEFNAPQTPGSARIIRVPLIALHNGDLRYNIAIHPHDVIVVQNLVVGEYYMGGHVARPGVYTLTSRKITIKEAVISAGMFDQLAIPERTEIIRRLRPDHEVFVRIDLDKIFTGQQPDLYLKPDDQIMVGTNGIAPFLAAVRGGFRISYGLGFLYDRNFAYSTQTGF
ncbi:MAG TPA: polysaccharide biosynthesis/export family protein [Tepidisphaeraceae bacterium]|nr:polysaccharide biosynthesis/export family protein [Tepidisphaeraceae bacterium]